MILLIKLKTKTLNITLKSMGSSPCLALLFILSHIIMDELCKILYIFNLILKFFLPI